MRRIACSKVKHSEHSRPQTCLQRLTILSLSQKTVMRSKVWSSVDLATRSLHCYYRLLSSASLALPLSASSMVHSEAETLQPVAVRSTLSLL